MDASGCKHSSRVGLRAEDEEPQGKQKSTKKGKKAVGGVRYIISCHLQLLMSICCTQPS